LQDCRSFCRLGSVHITLTLFRLFPRVNGCKLRNIQKQPLQNESRDFFFGAVISIRVVDAMVS